jgi:cleavage stimulation factor subunit 3
VYHADKPEAYLHYIRRQNPVNDSAPNAEQARTTVNQAYEFALKECGFDRESGELWQEYIEFVAGAKVYSKSRADDRARTPGIRNSKRTICGNCISGLFVYH